MKRAVIVASIILVAAGLGCNDQREPMVVEFRIAETEPAAGLTEATFTGWGHSRVFHLHDKVLMDGSEIAEASVITVQGHPAVEVVFSRKGREIFARATGENVGRHMGMLVDGVLVSVPLIRHRIDTGEAIINGDFTGEWAGELVRSLNDS